jgi:valyl-tRNA synthetase
MMVLREAPESCTKCGAKEFHQDEDVLDTWFSSWLWPFSTQGWPKKTEDFGYFYPTDILVTAPDIIFFWVARMIMAGLEFIGKVPFSDVVLNGIVRDEHGRKSKSLGNGIDPLEMIEKFSADAVRFTLIMLSSEGQDMNLSVNHFEMGRNFSNKIWNAYRFLSNHLDSFETDFDKYNKHFELADRWILSSLQKTIEQVNTNLEKFRTNEALNVVYQFFWHDYCDWYLELIKKRLYQTENVDARKTALNIAGHIMKETMNLLHPFIPFLTEEIWQSFKADTEQSIVISPWPQQRSDFIDLQAEKEMKIIQDTISSIRNIRAEMEVPPARTASLYLRAKDSLFELFKGHQLYFESLAKVEKIKKYTEDLQRAVMATAVVNDVEIFLPLAELIDIEKEKIRLDTEIKRLENLDKTFSAKLANENFINKAPQKVVQAEREKLIKIQESLQKIKASYDNLLGH